MSDFVNADAEWQVFHSPSQMHLLNTTMLHTSHLSEMPTWWQGHQPGQTGLPSSPSFEEQTAVNGMVHVLLVRLPVCLCSPWQ